MTEQAGDASVAAPSKETSLQRLHGAEALAQTFDADHGAGRRPRQHERRGRDAAARSASSSAVGERRGDELRDQPRHAAGRKLPMTLARRAPGACRCASLARSARRSAAGVTGSLPPDRISVGTSLCSGAPKSSSTGPRGQPSQIARMPRHERRAEVRLRQRCVRNVLLRPARRVFAADDREVHARRRSASSSAALDHQVLRGQCLRLRATSALRGSAAATSTRSRPRSSAVEPRHPACAPVERRVGDRAAERIAESTASPAACCSRRLQRCELRGDVGKRRAHAASAAQRCEGAVDRPLRFDRDVGPERELRGHDTVENRRAHAFGIATHVVLRDARAVRDAVEIQRADSRAPRARRRDRARRRWSCSSADRPAAPPGTRCTAACSFCGSSDDEFGVVRQLAVQAVGAPGAALIDQHDVAVAPDARERRRDRTDRNRWPPVRDRRSGRTADRRRASGAARERRRRAIAILCSADRRDFPRTRQPAAASRDAAAGHRALQAAVARAAAARPANAAPIALQNVQRHSAQ